MKKKIVIIGFVLIATIPFFIVGLNYKPSIHNATISQLDKVESLGTVLSKQVYDYVQKNDVDFVIELEGRIKYLGKERLENLKDVYR